MAILCHTPGIGTAKKYYNSVQQDHEDHLRDVEVMAQCSRMILKCTRGKTGLVRSTYAKSLSEIFSEALHY